MTAPDIREVPALDPDPLDGTKPETWTTSNATIITSTIDLTPDDRPWMKRAVGWFLDHLCSLLHDFAGCALLNGHAYLFWDEANDRHRVEFDGPFRWTERLWVWAAFPPEVYRAKYGKRS